MIARFPTQVGGQPVTNVGTFRLTDFFHLIGFTEAQLEPLRQNLATIGISLDTIAYGTATIGGQVNAIEAFRVPGQDASKLIPIVGINFYTDRVATPSQETVGGKNVTVVRDIDPVRWMYANGDILWLVESDSPDLAAAVFTALP